jgi:ribonuclease HI
MWKLYTDGAARGNPGPAGAGAVLLDAGGGQVATLAEYLGKLTNNEAEYAALLKGLELARTHGATELLVHMDSELVVRQLLGRYKVKAEHLRPTYEKALKELKTFKTWSVVHVRREQNSIADQLANLGVDQGLGKGAGA